MIMIDFKNGLWFIFFINKSSYTLLRIFWGYMNTILLKLILKNKIIIMTNDKFFRRAYGVFLLAPHTSGPRDVPRCEALSLLQKTPHYRGDPAETAAGLNAAL
jgi:hypothetical protein